MGKREKSGAGILAVIVLLLVGAALLPTPRNSRVLAAPTATGFGNCEVTRTRLVIEGQASGTTAVQLVPAVAGEPIDVCSMTIIGVSGTNPTFSLVGGTGSNCASNTATVLPAFNTTAGTPVIWNGPLVTDTASGSALCYLLTGTTPVVNYVVTYVQG